MITRFNLRRWSGALARYLFCFGLLPNLPFWILARMEGVATPPLINVDGLALGVLALYVRPGWVIALFACDFLLDIVYAIKSTYGTAYTDIILSVRYLFTAVAFGQLLMISLEVIGSVAIIGWLWCKLRPRVAGRERLALIAAVAVLFLPWAWYARSQRMAARAQGDRNASAGYVDANDVGATYASAGADSLRSPGLAFYHAWKVENMWATLRGHNSVPLLPTGSATAHALPLLDSSGHPENLVVMLVESWGSSQDVALRDALAAPLTSSGVTARYQVEQGEVGFAGSTGPGELRELCGARLADGTRAALSPEYFASCLPWRLDQAGYQTTAMDSAASFWPGGSNWYRLFGFQDVWDFYALEARGLQVFTAGPFRSMVDGQVIAEIPKVLQQRAGKPQFVYMLTINSHLPIHLPLASGYNAPCDISPATQASPVVCGWYRLERSALDALAKAALTPGLPPTVFVVVGDHIPPFVGKPRTYFSESNVPYVILRPR